MSRLAPAPSLALIPVKLSQHPPNSSLPAASPAEPSCRTPPPPKLPQIQDPGSSGPTQRGPGGWSLSSSAFTLLSLPPTPPPAPKCSAGITAESSKKPRFPGLSHCCHWPLPPDLQKQEEDPD